MSPSNYISSSTAGVLEINPFFTDDALEKNALAEKNRLNTYRYGFNGMEKDDEVKGSGNHMTTQWRQYDPRIGRWFTMDPQFRYFAAHSPYHFSLNSPISLNDPNGDCPPGVNCPPKSGPVTPKAVDYLPSREVSQLWSEGMDLLEDAFFCSLSLGATILGVKGDVQVGPIQLEAGVAVAEGSLSVNENGDVNIDADVLSASGGAGFASANVKGEIGAAKINVLITEDDIVPTVDEFYAEGSATVGANGFEWSAENAATLSVGGKIGPVRGDAGVNFANLFEGFGKIIEGGARYLEETATRLVE